MRDYKSERPNTIAGLREKHREIAGLVDARRRELNALIADLDALTHTIRIFDPDAGLPRAKPSYSGTPRLNSMRRYVMAALKSATGPLTSLDIAREIVVAQRLDDGPATVSMIGKRVRAALWRLKAKGWVRVVPQEGDYKGWAWV